jgi:sodium-dependent dicarboxylate transporter 2/3/5
MLPIAWLVLVRVIFPLGRGALPGGHAALVEAAGALGPPSRGEWLTGIVFGLAALAWIVQPLLERVIPGLSDAGIAMTGALLLFVLPVRPRSGTFVLDWTSAARIPWGVLVLFGGGLTLARAIATTGLADWIGHAMSRFGGLPILGVMAVITVVVMLLTELTSNTATTATFLPIVASFAVGMGRDPLLLAVPATLAASCAFMLPVATPPNAIVYASGEFTVPQMARAGVLLDLIFAVVLPPAMFLLLMLVFGVHTGR